jgi:transcription initiation factor TFIIF subunit beta
MVPKEYNMEITEPNVTNTFMFTEQDLPGYAAKNKAKADALAQGIPAHLLRQKVEKQEGNQGFERGKRGAPPQRRAIPSERSQYSPYPQL